MSSTGNRGKFYQLCSIVRQLRSRNGCPWDIKQTPESIKKYLLEETRELAEALDLGDATHIRDEIGDLFFILTMLVHMHEEQGKFTEDDVFDAIAAKMIRRHPHVFSGLETGNDEELSRQWQKIKKLEKKQNT